MRVKTLLMRMCAVQRVRACVRALSVHFCAGYPHFTFQSFVLFGSAWCCCCCCTCHVYITTSLQLSSSTQFFGRNGTTTVAHQVPLSRRPRTGHQLVRACACCVSCGNEQIVTKEVKGRCERGRAIQTHTYLLGIFQATVQPWLQQQQRYNSTSVSNSGVYDSHDVFVFYIYFEVCVQCSQGHTFYT